MKIRFYLALAAAALVMTNCSQDEELVQVKQPTKGFTATIEGASRSNATETGAFSWTFGDAISVWNGSTFDKYANSEGNESTFTFTPNADEEAETPTGYAIYPAGMHSISGQTVTIDLPSTYAHGSTNAPMWATIIDGSTTLAFKHLGGLMRFVVKNVPEGASSFVFTTTNNILTGRYDVINGQIHQNGEDVVDNTNNNVTITFTELTAKAESMVFFVPLPVGTYGNYTVAIKGTNVDLSHPSTGVTNTIGRCTMLLMPEFTCTDTGLDKASLAEIPVTGQDVDLSGIQNVTIGTANAGEDEVLDINYTPQEGNAILNITDDSNATESQEISKGKINIIPTDAETPIESLNLNTPSLTAELGAGNYGTVEALTAKQTLIIGNGVTIEELILNGGALKVAEGATNVTIGNIVVKDETGLRSAVAVGGKVKLGDDITIEDTDGISVGEGKTVTLDLNGKNVTAQGDGLVAGTGTTLTLDATNGGSLTAGVTKGNWVAVWANGGTITINGGTYHVGLDQTDSNSCIYAKNGGNITINGGEFSHEQPTSGNNYGMPLQVNNAKGSGTIIVKGGTYTLDNGRYYEAQDRQHGTIIIAGTESTENGETTVTANTTGILNETELKNALKSATGTATLNADICLTSSITISSDITIDLNGYYIVSQSADAFAVNSGTLTLNDTSTGKTGHVVASPYDDQSANAVWANGGNVVINGGSYKVGGDINSNDKRNDCIYVGSEGGTIEIYDGEFQYTGDVVSGDEGTNKDGNRFLINQKDSHTEQLITIYGGVFHNFNPSNAETNDGWMTNGVGSYVASGYSSSTSDNGATYQVSKNQ